MELRQVVRYSGESREAVVRRVRTDLGVAASAGFQPLRWAHWEARRSRPCLVVEYRWAPPATVERRRFAPQLNVGGVLADDAAAMAHAGYVQEEHAYVRAPGGGGDLVLQYRYDPAVAGAPIGPLPTPLGEPRGPWWVLWPDDLGVQKEGVVAATVRATRRAAARVATVTRHALAEVHPPHR